MCPAVNTSARSLLRSSSSHEPSDPPLEVEFYICFVIVFIYTLFEIFPLNAFPIVVNSLHISYLFETIIFTTTVL